MKIHNYVFSTCKKPGHSAHRKFSEQGNCNETIISTHSNQACDPWRDNRSFAARQPLLRARGFERPRREPSWCTNGKATRTGSQCSATACRSTAAVTVRSPRSRADHGQPDGQGCASSGSERQRWTIIMERSKASIRRSAIYTTRCTSPERSSKRKGPSPFETPSLISRRGQTTS